ncbi:MAG: glycogen phosphorylase, partial [Betaproteobacteria bacterium]|nr:glycogen phosphorylase [Betaproteobacteria bacterium]
PHKFSNKTNGVTPRRWLVLANPALAKLVSGQIGEGWVRDLGLLRGIEPLADDAGFSADWRAIKLANKTTLATLIRERTGLVVNPTAIFDVQVKRIHEYKRQHLNILHVIGLYLRLKTDPHFAPAPRVFIFGGKAAPGYAMAKLIIRLITAVAEVVNRDPAVRDLLKVVFIPNFSVTNGQHIYPAADLSEQISTAGKEASGTGNMKFQMNGALTIGTLDGANIEIREEVGAENFFLFGLSAAEVAARKAAGYRPADCYAANEGLRAVLDLIAEGFFAHGDPTLFQPLLDNLLQHDPYLVLADYAAYADCQQAVNDAWCDPARWTRMSILNTARAGKFSSDRSIREYCREI